MQTESCLVKGDELAKFYVNTYVYQLIVYKLIVGSLTQCGLINVNSEKWEAYLRKPASHEYCQGIWKNKKMETLNIRECREGYTTCSGYLNF